MITRNVTVTANKGLYARAATCFIQKAVSYQSAIWIENGDRRINAKSLLGVLSLGITEGMTVSLIADGKDELDALDALTELIGTATVEA